MTGSDLSGLGLLQLLDLSRQAEKDLARAQQKSDAASAARMRLPAGSSRARVTTANARWATAAEARDRVAARLDSIQAEIQSRVCTSDATEVRL